MEASEAKKLAESVEAGLRDGRSLESLRKAMKDSGYEDGDIREILSRVDRKNTGRKPKKKKTMGKEPILIAIAIIVVIILSASMLTRPAQEPNGGYSNASGNSSTGDTKTCYVLNESVKELMIKAGAKCDRWYLIEDISSKGKPTAPISNCYVIDEAAKEAMIRAGAKCDRWYFSADVPSIEDYTNATKTCYVLNEDVKAEMIRSGAKCDKWYLIQEI